MASNNRNHWCLVCGATYHREYPPESCRYCSGGSQFKSETNLGRWWLGMRMMFPFLNVVEDVVMVQVLLWPLFFYFTLHYTICMWWMGDFLNELDTQSIVGGDVGSVCSISDVVD